MCVVGVGLKKVYKALIRGASSVPLLMSMLEAFSVSFLILIKLCYTHTHTQERNMKKIQTYWKLYVNLNYEDADKNTHTYTDICIHIYTVLEISLLNNE